jgi:uncharacterized cupredoxin-like copper-binding protein
VKRRLAALVLVGALASLAMTCAKSGAAGGATIDIHFSHYTPGEMTARAGVSLTITLRNNDPIEHEWIVGTEVVHQRHRTGTEPYHGTIPTEVTIPALSSRVTTVTFAEPGDYQYICHLPGHEAYGMVGTLHVVA